jgi:hypothetical protein
MNEQVDMMKPLTVTVSNKMSKSQVAGYERARVLMLDKVVKKSQTPRSVID